MYKTLLELCSQLQIKFHDNDDSYSKKGRLIFAWISRALNFNVTNHNKSLFSNDVTNLYFLIDKKNIAIPSTPNFLLILLERIIFRNANQKKSASFVNFFKPDPLAKDKLDFLMILKEQVPAICHNNELLYDLLALAQSIRFEMNFGIDFQNEVLNFLKQQISNMDLSLFLENLSHHITLDQLEDKIALLLTDEDTMKALYPDEINTLKEIMRSLSIIRPTGAVGYHRQLQRKAIYRQLYKVFETEKYGFELICPVNHALDPFMIEDNGYCHGYSIFWLDKMISGKSDQVTQPYDWKQLIGEYYYDVQGLPLSEEIIKLHQQQKSSATQRMRYSNAIQCQNLEELTASIASIITTENPSNKAHLVNLRAKPEASALPYPLTVAAFYFPQLIHEWHEISCYQDEVHHIHWFDSNIGWFKSHSPNPSFEQFKKFLMCIFQICQYDRQYNATSVVEVKINNGNYHCYAPTKDLETNFHTISI